MPTTTRRAQLACAPSPKSFNDRSQCSANDTHNPLRLHLWHNAANSHTSVVMRSSRTMKNAFARATATIEHDLERMTARETMFNEGSEPWCSELDDEAQHEPIHVTSTTKPWRSSRGLLCVVDHATYLIINASGMHASRKTHRRSDMVNQNTNQTSVWTNNDCFSAP